MWIGEVGFCLGLGVGVWRCSGWRCCEVVYGQASGVIECFQLEFLCKDIIAFNPRINPQTYQTMSNS